MTFKFRPPITVIIVCLFELLGIILIPSALFKETTKEIGLWYQIYIILSGFISAFVIWMLLKMKKLGLYTYFILYAIHNVVALFAGNWLVYVLIIPAIGAVLLLPYAKKMK
jgi:hypothetical protein